MELEKHLRLILTSNSKRGASEEAYRALSHHGNSKDARRLIQEATSKRKNGEKLPDPIEVLGIDPHEEKVSDKLPPGEKVIGPEGIVVYASRGQTQNHI